MRTAVDVRKYRETMREQGKSSLVEARKFVRACVGASELAYERVRTELKDLPARNRAQVMRLRKRAKVNRAEVRKHMLTTYDDLAERGEVVIRRLREHPQARLVFTRHLPTVKHTEEKAERVTHPAPEAAEPVAERVIGDGRKPVDVRKPVQKAPAHKGTARR